jgi:tRNA1Val (adenine37-N6)-methyltransferase
MSDFRFKNFGIQQDKCAMKIGTDGVLLGAWANIAQASSILDIGTGTGVLAIMAAQRNTEGNIHAIEIEKEAYLQATKNSLKSPWQERILVIHDSIQNYSNKPNLHLYDSIISNPPFFDVRTNTQIENKARSKARSTDSLTFESLLDAVLLLLTPKGNFSLTLPLQEGRFFIELAKEKGFYLRRLTEVIPRVGKTVNRLLIELVLYPTTPIEDSLTIRNEGKVYHDYTPAYTLLHQDFYLFM